MIQRTDGRPRNPQPVHDQSSTEDSGSSAGLRASALKHRSILMAVVVLALSVIFYRRLLGERAGE